MVWENREGEWDGERGEKIKIGGVVIESQKAKRKTARENHV